MSDPAVCRWLTFISPRPLGMRAKEEAKKKKGRVGCALRNPPNLKNVVPNEGVVVGKRDDVSETNGCCSMFKDR